MTCAVLGYVLHEEVSPMVVVSAIGKINCVNAILPSCD